MKRTSSRPTRPIRQPITLDDITQAHVRGGASMVEYATLQLQVLLLAAGAIKAMGTKSTQQMLDELANK